MHIGSLSELVRRKRTAAIGSSTYWHCSHPDLCVRAHTHAHAQGINEVSSYRELEIASFFSAALRQRCLFRAHLSHPSTSSRVRRSQMQRRKEMAVEATGRRTRTLFGKQLHRSAVASVLAETTFRAIAVSLFECVNICNCRAEVCELTTF
jgi:hypothetical protein